MKGMLACGHCGGDDVEAVSDGTRTNLRCVACGACWHVELGWVSLVDVATCPGCAHRASCTSSPRPVAA